MPDGTASPSRLAFSRFWVRRSSRLGTYALASIVALAIYAPFLCSDTALVWWDDNGLRLPLIAELFNRRSYPKHHDLLFNLAALLTPLLLLATWCRGRRRPARPPLAAGAVLLLAAWTACQLPLVPSHGGWAPLWDQRAVSTCTIQLYRQRLAGAAPASAVFTPVPHRVDATYADAVLSRPCTMNPDTGARFWLGTDAVGHDVLAILLFGARISLTVGLVATGIAFAIGIAVGAASGYFGGWIDLILQRLVEIMMCFPTFILILSVVAMLSRDIFIIMAVIGLTGWAGTARLVRGEFLAQSVRDYVLAAQALGLPRWRIMFRHILPNAMAPLLITVTFGIAGSVLTEGGLSFIGLGDPTTASWGVLMEQGRQNIHYPWLIYAPGLALFILVMLLNLLGNNLRDAIDPKHAH